MWPPPRPIRPLQDTDATGLSFGIDLCTFLVAENATQAEMPNEAAPGTASVTTAARPLIPIMNTAVLEKAHPIVDITS